MFGWRYTRLGLSCEFVCVFALLNGKGEQKCVCSLSGMTMMHLYFQDTFIEKTDHPMEDVGGHRIDTPTQRAQLAQFLIGKCSNR